MHRGPKKFALHTADVSYRGLYVCTDSPPQLRQLVKVELALPPGGDSFVGHGMAVYVLEPGTEAAKIRTPGCGIQFYGVTGSEKAQWDAFIQWVSTEHGQSENEEVDMSGAGGQVARRKHERHAMQLEIRLQHADDLYTLYTRDISRGGMFISTDLELAADAELFVDLIHPATSQLFKLQCVVRHHIQNDAMHGVGVQFVNLDAALQEQLFDFISSDIEITEDPDAVFVAAGDPKLL